MGKAQADIGIFGGSGFYSLAQGVRTYAVQTPYGPPSDRIAVAEIEGRNVAFLPRHGRYHQYPPHTINYRANLWAMQEMGVTRIISPSACGSLSPSVEPGHFVFCDQFVNLTYDRKDTFYDGPLSVHIATEEPYCPDLRALAADVAGDMGITYHRDGTVVVIQGPRFSTRAESKWFMQTGWSVINMTQYPEVTLARELGICFLNVSLVTDWDVGLAGLPGVRTVTADEVARVFNQNIERIREFLFKIIPAIPEGRGCICKDSLEGAIFSPSEIVED
jgi:5'-methylthioadenosine phosphorylase